MKTKILFSLALLLICGYATSQDKDTNPQLFRGVIMDSDSIQEISYARYIINDTVTHVANSAGEFLFLANEGDMVKFTHVGYKPLFLQVSDSLRNNKFLMGVFLSKDTIQLSEVVIIPQNVNPSAVARNLPLMTSSDAISAQNNLNRSAYQAKTQSIKVWDAEMNQKNYIQARSNDVTYKHQYQPNQIVRVSNREINAELERQKLNKTEAHKRVHVTNSEWEYLLATYRERQKIKLEKIAK